jgi:hypothetical protein
VLGEMQETSGELPGVRPGFRQGDGEEGEGTKMNRAERRRMAREGNYSGVWERRLSPKESGVGDNWFGEMDRAFTDGKYAVMIRTTNTAWGLVDHACIRNTGNTDIPWRDKWKIKNELFGPERVAIEVFPAESELVDEANMYHVWVLPAGFKVPFGL